MATVRIEYFGMSGEGRNVTEAKRDAGRKLESTMTSDYQPVILSAGDQTVILFRSPQYGWQYGFLRDNDICSTQGATSDKQECERHARRHIGSNATDWRTCVDASFVHPIVVNAADRREIATNCQWQRDYHKWLALGMTDNDCRSAISGFTQFLSDDGKAIYAAQQSQAA